MTRTRLGCFGFTAALALAGCGASQMHMGGLDGGAGDGDARDGGGAGDGDAGFGAPDHVAPYLGDGGGPDADRFTQCPETPRGCDLPAGNYVPVIDGPATVVWTPSADRYTNEPTLLRDNAGTWHVIANSATGIGNPWHEQQLVHATASSLYGPWTEQPDVLTYVDTGATETELWAPFVMREGAGYRLLYWALNLAGREELHDARSTDMYHWTRQPPSLPGGRDAMMLTLADGRRLLYTVATLPEADGVHDAVAVFESPSADAPFGPQRNALRNPEVCPANCWGFYESPYVLEVAGQYYLFTTWTDSGPDTYERTAVFRSSDPTHFEPTPVGYLQAHGGEFHVENGRMYLTRGGWPQYVPDRRGLSVVPIAWVRVP